MDPAFPATCEAYWDLLRPHVPAQHCTSCGGDVWALARLGPTRTWLTHCARLCVLGDRQLASWERCLAEDQGALPGVSQTLVTRVRLQGGRATPPGLRMAA
jgi:hypothetical protein